MINIFALSSLVLATLHMAVAPVSAHGFVSQPPSRQLLCRDVPVPGCGDVKYEPQSVEAPKGSFACNGDGARFPQLNDESLWRDYAAQVYPGDAPLTFTWTLTAPHATAATWEYFVLTDGNTKLASFDDGGAVPPYTVVHQVPLHDYTGRQTILARWNIADTPAAFYACVDLDIGSNTATVVAGAAATQVPIGIRLGGGLGLAANDSANTGPSANMHLRNGFITHKGSS
ncbi:immunoglobulin E-set [Mycena galopus ATCC 62051]|nr:immunoglobulin E-set [Mycena galopus ATCC 62051]